MRDPEPTSRMAGMPRISAHRAIMILALIASAAAAQPQRPTPDRAASDTINPRRVVHLAGGQNFRDLGGYRTVDGRRVRWGRIYRSGAMSALTVADFAILRQRRIGEIFDLRSTPERHQAPVLWPADYTPVVHATDYRLDLGGMTARLTDPTLTDAAAIDLGRDFYAGLPYQFASQYRALFEALLRGDGPVAFNCSAGKDRTGVAAALVLTALGVPRATITADYLLSNRLFDPDRTRATDVGADATARGASAARSPMVRLLMSVDARLLDAAFTGIDVHSGSVDAYLRDELGVGPAERARLRTLYLA